MDKLIIYFILVWFISKLAKILSRTMEKEEIKEKIEYKPVYADDIKRKISPPSKQPILTTYKAKEKELKPAPFEEIKKRDWHSYLASPSSLRDAIIIAEILNRPLSEREL